METQKTDTRVFHRKSAYNRFIILQELNRRIKECSCGAILINKYLARDIANKLNCGYSITRETLRDYSYGKLNEIGDIIENNNTEGASVC